MEILLVRSDRIVHVEGVYKKDYSGKTSVNEKKDWKILLLIIYKRWILPFFTSGGIFL